MTYYDYLFQMIPLKDNGDFNIYKAEANPEFFKYLCDVLKENGITGIIWEPFAGQSRVSQVQDLAEEIEGIELISYDLSPIDPRILKMNSIVSAPDCKISGLYFHPPYLMSATMSECEGEISSFKTLPDYLEQLDVVIQNAVDRMGDIGFCCAIGRAYSYNGKRINLSKEFYRLFTNRGFGMVKIVISEPDVGLVMKWEKK